MTIESLILSMDRTLLGGEEVEFFSQLKNYFERLTLGQRIMTVVVFLGVCAVVGLLSYFLKYDSYATLYSRLSEDDAAHIVEQLKNEKVPFRLSNSGKTIKVPSKDLYGLRLKLSAQGLPRGGQSGLELFDKANLGMTDFMQQVNYQRAIQGELARTIEEMESVQQAKVLITFPESSDFLEEDKSASASVMVNLHPGAVLDQKQIMGIVSLVSGAVKGLKPENVTLVDAYGNLLTKSGDENSVYSGADGSLSLRRNVESYLENKSLSLLERVLGPGKAVVRVTADLNNQRIREQTESYDQVGALRSEQTSRSPTGVSLKNYEIGKTIREVSGTAGNIEHLYVSVVIDGVAQTNPDDPTKVTFVPRSEQELESYRQLVMQAVGFSDERGDQIDIKSIPFDREHSVIVSKQMEEQQKTMDDVKKRERISSLAGKGILSLAMVIVIVLMINAMKKSVADQKMLAVAMATPQLALSAAGAVNAVQPRLEAAAPKSMESRSEAMPDLNENLKVMEKQTKSLPSLELEILKAAKENPAEVARVMRRTWIQK